MATYQFDQDSHKAALLDFFKANVATIHDFGSKVNQTFEAFTFAQFIKWYRQHGWDVTIINPSIAGESVFRLKYNTRGAPGNYSYARCEKDGLVCQIRHQLRVETRYGKLNGKRFKPRANMVCDIAVVQDVQLDNIKGDMHCPNECLISFCECKHMNAFAELIASFIGLVHELMPDKLRRTRTSDYEQGDHLPPCLHVSQTLNPTAQGLIRTVEKRKYDVDVYWHGSQIV